MNGVASSSMREKGISYKLNFGLMQEQIKRIAESYRPDSQLAELLWNEDTRELKILATLLYPIAEFGEEQAEAWLNSIPNQEMREQICLNLFQRLPYAEKKGMEWANNTDYKIRTTGYWLLARLILSKRLAEKLRTEDFRTIWDDIVSEDLFLRNASLLILKHIGRQSKEDADKIINTLKPFKNNENPVKKEVYDSLSFEFEFYFG